MEILNWFVDVVTLPLDAGYLFNFYKLFPSLFANTVNFLETLHFLKVCCNVFQAEMKQVFRPGLLFPTSKAILSSRPC